MTIGRFFFTKVLFIDHRMIYIYNSIIEIYGFYYVPYDGVI